MNSKIRAVLDSLEARMEYEDAHEEIPIEERSLAITPGTGSFYNLVLKLVRAKRVLEIGTSMGYSTLWFAEALPPDGSSKILTVEQSHRKAVQAAKNFDEAGVSHLIEIMEGNAIAVLDELASIESYRNSFDFVFIDADKENAIQYFERAIQLARPGGLIGADNLHEPPDCVEPMSRYSNHIRARDDVQTVTVPVGKGQELTIKLA